MLTITLIDSMLGKTAMEVVIDAVSHGVPPRSWRSTASAAPQSTASQRNLDIKRKDIY